jgi:hypothetical protein
MEGPLWELLIRFDPLTNMAVIDNSCYLDSSGSKKQEFAEEEAKKLDSESKDKSEGTTRLGYDTNYYGSNISYHFANEATKYLKQAQASANQTKHWRKKLNNENHYQAMRNDTLD